MTQNFKKICDKKNVLLEYNKDTNIYSLLFNIENKKKINIKELLDKNIFHLLKTINTEIINDVIEIISDDDENIILFIFNEIGKEAGLKQKYMFLNNKKCFDENKLIIKTKSVTKNELLQNKLLDNNIIQKLNNLQEIICEFATLNVNNINELNVNIHYIFKIILEDNLPSYLENILGLLMKKIFLNLKIFIEETK
tara:strand:+ start:52 stop:639 length:588 start_codon:yes stop_codon:yes gene_type:complete